MSRSPLVGACSVVHSCACEVFFTVLGYMTPIVKHLAGIHDTYHLLCRCICLRSWNTWTCICQGRHWARDHFRQNHSQGAAAERRWRTVTYAQQGSTWYVFVTLAACHCITVHTSLSRTHIVRLRIKEGVCHNTRVCSNLKPVTCRSRP